MKATVKATEYTIEIELSDGNQTETEYYKKFSHQQTAPLAKTYLDSQIGEINTLFETDEDAAFEKIDECVGQIEYAANYELTKAITIPMA